MVALRGSCWCWHCRSTKAKYQCVWRSVVQPRLPLHFNHSALTSPAWSLSLGNHSRSTAPFTPRGSCTCCLPWVSPHLLCLSSCPPDFTNPCTHSPQVGLILFRRCFDTTHKTQQRHLTLLNVNKELSDREVKDLFIEKMPAALSKPHWMTSQSASWCSLPGVFLLSPMCSTVPSLQSQLHNWW